MYLLVFVTMVVALIGIYTQTLSVQTTRLYSHQTGLADTMMTWHSTAVALAHYTQITNATVGGCDLTAGGLIGTTCVANGGNKVTVSTINTTGWPACVNPATAPCWNGLPPTYNVGTYTFYSVFFQTAAGQNYVVTFVPSPTPGPANPAPANIVLPGELAAANTQIGMTLSDLTTQLKNVGISPLFYGITELVGPNIELVTPSVSSGNNAVPTALNYILPAAIPVNSIAILSTP